MRVRVRRPPSESAGLPAAARGRPLSPPRPLRPRSAAAAPPLYGGFVRPPPVVSYARSRACRRCADSCLVTCGDCAGAGRLVRGGYQKRNPVSAARVLGGWG